MKPSAHPDLSRCEAEPVTSAPEPSLTRRVLAHNPNLMLVEHRMEPGWVGTRRSDPHDQLVYVLSGRLEFQCGAEPKFEARMAVRDP